MSTSRAGERAELPAEPLRIGVVGVGALALRGILPHLAQADVSDRIRVSALCDPVAERASAAAERFGVPQFFESIEDLVRSGAVDAVTIASPIGLHFEHCRIALEAGLHAHVNKTLATTVAEADTLIDLARERDLRLVASPGEVLRPQVQRARELIASGAIGDVSWAICGGAFESYHESDEPERLQAPGGLPINPAWYFRKPGGGPMYDITVYALHQLTSVLGPAKRVTALSGIRVPHREFAGKRITTEADDNTILLLDFGDGLFAVAFGTAAGAVSDQVGACVYFGTRGTIDGVLLNGEPFEFPGREATLPAPVSDWDAQVRTLEHVVGAHREIPEAHVFEDIMQLVGWVREGVPSPVTAEHARHVVDIIESGYRSAEGGSAESLTTVFELAEVGVATAS
jgi:predicted dehydrogenase